MTPPKGDFVGDWRRKIGCVLLVLACLLMAGWVRSHSTNDGFNIGICRLESSDGMLELGSPALVEGVDTFCYVGILSIHYWSIVMPLTLLSAYLLLGIPRQSNQSKTSELTARERRDG
jgi:hypothetical protein